MGGISASVGKGGKNKPDDVQVVKRLLNTHRPEVGYARLQDGPEFDKDTLKAILAVQAAIGIKSPDGRVDPGGKTWKALEARELPKPDDEKKGAGKGGGKVTGNLSGVQSDIVDMVKAVADFYGQEIRISSGKRDAKDQGRAMFDNWTGNLKRGLIYTYLKTNSKVQKELDELYVKAAEDKKASSKDAADAKAKFMKICADAADQLSLHVAGKAIDVSPKSCMTKAMREAMQKGGLRELEEKTCYHYDTKGSALKVTDALKKSWKAP